MHQRSAFSSFSPKILLQLLLVLAALCSHISLAQSGGILKRFKKAEALFSQKKYDAAISSYLAILKTYPGHEPSRIGVARGYFKLGKYDKSYDVFSQLSFERLEPESAYEAGQVFLRKEKLDQAQRVLRRIPQWS